MPDSTQHLTPRAAACRDARLPVLLAAVRWRRRRRHAARAVAALLLVGVGAFVLWPGTQAPRPVEPVATPSPSWTVLRDDPTVLARNLLPTRRDPAWFLGDDELRHLLRLGDRPDGLVRVGARVQVAAAAIDPWPGTAP